MSGPGQVHETRGRILTALLRGQGESLKETLDIICGVALLADTGDSLTELTSG
jgi:hypothetical protein